MTTFFENTQKLVEDAANIAGIAGDVLIKLQRPDKIFEFEISVGNKKFPAWRVQHNNTLGPYKGGIRFHPESNLDEVKALASLMTWKTSLMGLPFGGAKGAVRVDPKNLSAAELEELSRGYVRVLWKEIGPDKDIPAPDVGTNPQVIDWMTDEYSQLVGKWTPSAFTGKSLKNSGSRGREVATGFGGYTILREFLKKFGNGKLSIGNSQPEVAVQGFGNVGANISQILFKNGFKIVAISDSKGALYEEGGIDINKVLDIKEKTGIIARAYCYALTPHSKSCRHFTNEELLELPVDVLIPAALENVITVENANKIKAKVILEMANGPTTPEAEKILIGRGVEILPDILANGGGVVGSYFEWIQNRQNEEWSANEVLKKIDEKLTEAFWATAEIKEKYRNSWRMASYIRAISRVAKQLK